MAKAGEGSGAAHKVYSRSKRDALAGGPPRQIILGEPQRLALEWLMGGSITEAGQYARVSRQTVSQWLNHDEDSRELFEQWQQQSVGSWGPSLYFDVQSSTFKVRRSHLLP